MNKNQEFVADLIISVLKTEPNPPLYLGFFTSDLYDLNHAGKFNITEISHDPSYIRQPVQLRLKNDIIKLLNNVKFPKATKNWMFVTHFGIFDEPKNGNLLFLKATGSCINIATGDGIALNCFDFIVFAGYNLLNVV